jgi:hypothetical protein
MNGSQLYQYANTKLPANNHPRTAAPCITEGAMLTMGKISQEPHVETPRKEPPVLLLELAALSQDLRNDLLKPLFGCPSERELQNDVKLLRALVDCVGASIALKFYQNNEEYNRRHQQRRSRNVTVLKSVNDDAK